MLPFLVPFCFGVPHPVARSPCLWRLRVFLGGIPFFCGISGNICGTGCEKIPGCFFRPRFFFCLRHCMLLRHCMPQWLFVASGCLLPAGAPVGESLPVGVVGVGGGLRWGMWMPVWVEACQSGCESVADECGMNAVTPWLAGVCADMALWCGSWRLDGCDFCANFASSIRNRGRAHEQLLTRARELRHTHTIY